MISSSSRGAVAPRISVRPATDDVGGPGELGSAEPGRLTGQPLGLVVGQLDQPAAAGVGNGRHDDQVAQPVQQVLGEPAWVLPGVDDLLDHPEQRRAVVGGERVDRLVEQAARACSRAMRSRAHR